ALGDPECRIVILLGDSASDAGDHHHRPVEPDRDEYLGGPPRDPLTRREREIVKLIAGSSTGREIAAAVAISDTNVERHRPNILPRLGLRDRVALTRYAIRHGLVEA